MLANTRFSKDKIQKQLDRILAWEGIKRAGQLREFLRFVVEATLKGKSDCIKSYTIAIDVLGRSKDFDPQADPIVRIIAGRLRHRLEIYYATTGRNDPIRITIPKGTYKPVFDENVSESPVNKDSGAATTNSFLSDSSFTGSKKRQRPSVAVMPFMNLNRDREFDYFAYGLGEELTSRLSLPKGLAVVPHYSMMQYKDKIYDLKQVAREQNVDYLVTGSIYRGESRLRLTLQLIALPSSRQIWDKAFDIPLTGSGLVELQKGIMQQVVASVADHYGSFNQTLWKASKAKQIQSLTAYEAILRYYHWNLYPSANNQAVGRTAMQHALALDPEYAEAWAILGETYCDAYIYVGNDNNPLDSAADCVRKALNLEPNCQYAYYTKGLLHALLKEREAAIQASENIVALNPDSAFMVGAAGVWLGLVCEYERGIEYIQKSINMAPAFPGWFYFIPFANLFRRGKYEEALSIANKVNLPQWFWDPLVRAATLGQLNRTEEAQAARRELCAIKPKFDAEAAYFINALLMDDILIEGLFEGLYKAGHKA